ncbi:hypothetical protein LXA43DRAFT_992256 [Ganoderma leucocontextum]|nr:hypothetical protein LXA43DRAFT_992256 [Ganoderma leucocontextum]
MSQDSRPPKRRRDGEDGTEASQDPIDGLKRSEEFWIPDGNIVLVAGGMAFRVYRGLLTLQSTVFADLFASSSPRAEESHDGCPIIHLTDSPQDLAHLLCVLLPASRTFFHRCKDDPKPSFDEVSAIIRLTHKYHIEGLLSQALSSLQEFFTTSFETWDDDSLLCPVKINPSAHIAVVSLARLTDTPSLLPLALYKCCSLAGALVDGWEREDGTFEYLSPEDLKRCLNARDALAKEAFSLVSAIFDPSPSQCCETFSTCESALRKTLAQVLDHDEVAESTVLESWKGVIQHYASRPLDEDGYCSACEDELVERDLREREYIWNRFPEIFDVYVPNWNQDPDEEEQSDDANSENTGN